MKKQVTFLLGLSQKLQTNGRAMSGDMTLAKAIELFPDFKEGNLSTMFSDPAIKHIVIVIYNDKDARYLIPPCKPAYEKRRLVGYPKRHSEDQLMDLMCDVAATLHIKLDRTLLVYEGGSK